MTGRRMPSSWGLKRTVKTSISDSHVKQLVAERVSCNDVMKFEVTHAAMEDWTGEDSRMRTFLDVPERRTED